MCFSLAVSERSPLTRSMHFDAEIEAFLILLIKYLGVFESPTGGESSDDYVVCFFTAIKVIFFGWKSIFRVSKAILSKLMRASF